MGRFIILPLPVPITMQFLFSNTAALTLGKRGYIPSLVYLLLGLAGVPVFTSGAGIGSLLELSFGYVLGFVLGAMITGIIKERTEGTLGLFAASVAGLVCVYVCGVSYSLLLSVVYLKQSTSAFLLLSIYLFPFILPDIVKCALSVVLYKKLKKYIKAPKA